MLNYFQLFPVEGASFEPEDTNADDLTSPLQKEFLDLELGADASIHNTQLHGRPRPTPRKPQNSKQTILQQRDLLS